MRYLPFDLQHLILIRVISDSGSYSGAALKLGISQPAITLRIKKLEAQLNIKLFKRERSMKLTNAGYVLYKYSEKILFLCEEAYTTLAEYRTNPESLTIGASQTPGTYLMPQILGLFKKRYPFTNIKLEIYSSRQIAWKVANGDIDFALIGGNIPYQLRNTLELTSYIDDELSLILPIDHPLILQKRIKKKDLYRLNFITLNKNSTIQNSINKTLNQNGIDSKRLIVDMELNNIEAIKNAVQFGLGVAFMSISAIARELKWGSLSCKRIEDIKIARTFSILVRPNKYKSETFVIFEREISSLFSSLSVQILNDLENT
jgi:DNA-binding transcriptional LysR family regulator